MGRVGDRAVLFTTEIQEGGNRFAVTRPEQGRLNRPHTVAADDSHRLTGRVQREKKVSTDSDQKATVVLLETEQGTAAVDLGTQRGGSMPELKGETITVVGPLRRFGDRLVLWAETIEVDGRTANIPRSAETGTGGSGGAQ
jgi:hypothetical protein